MRGNHDRHAGDPPAGWNVRCHDEPLELAPFVLRHVPAEDPGGYTLAGHIHPGVRLSGRGGQELKLPCFWFGPRGAVLPAFGSFTGTAAIAPRTGDRVFVVADGAVLPVRRPVRRVDK